MSPELPTPTETTSSLEEFKSQVRVVVETNPAIPSQYRSYMLQSIERLTTVEPNPELFTLQDIDHFDRRTNEIHGLYAQRMSEPNVYYDGNFESDVQAWLSGDLTITRQAIESRFQRKTEPEEEDEPEPTRTGGRAARAAQSVEGLDELGRDRRTQPLVKPVRQSRTTETPARAERSERDRAAAADAAAAAEPELPEAVAVWWRSVAERLVALRAAQADGRTRLDLAAGLAHRDRTPDETVAAIERRLTALSHLGEDQARADAPDAEPIRAESAPAEGETDVETEAVGPSAPKDPSVERESPPEPDAEPGPEPRPAPDHWDEPILAPDIPDFADQIDLLGWSDWSDQSDDEPLLRVEPLSFKSLPAPSEHLELSDVEPAAALPATEAPPALGTEPRREALAAEVATETPALDNGSSRLDVPAMAAAEDPADVPMLEESEAAVPLAAAPGAEPAERLASEASSERLLSDGGERYTATRYDDSLANPDRLVVLHGKRAIGFVRPSGQLNGNVLPRLRSAVHVPVRPVVHSGDGRIGADDFDDRARGAERNSGPGTLDCLDGDLRADRGADLLLCREATVRPGEDTGDDGNSYGTAEDQHEIAPALAPSETLTVY